MQPAPMPLLVWGLNSCKQQSKEGDGPDGKSKGSNWAEVWTANRKQNSWQKQAEVQRVGVYL